MAKKKLTTEQPQVNIGTPDIKAPTPVLSQEALDAQRTAVKAAQAAPAPATEAPAAPTAPVVDETRKALEEGLTQQYNNFYDIAQAKKTEMDAARERDAQQEQAYKKAAAWTGAGELAASLANLVGVGSFDSAHQQYKNTYSQDWMSKAEETRKARISRSENMKGQLDNLNAQLAQLKSGKAQALANYDYKKKQQDIAQQKADAYESYQVARTASLDAKNEVERARAAYWGAKSENEKAYYDARIKDLEEKQRDADQKLQIAREDLSRKERLTESQIGVNNARKAQIESKTKSPYDQFE